MASKSDLLRLLALTALIGSCFFVFSSAQTHLWANLALGLVAMVALSAFLLAPRTAPETLATAPLPPVTENAPLHLLLDQVPVPLLRYSSPSGLWALNRSARLLFDADELIANAPAPLIDAMRSEQAGVRRVLRLFDRSYAVTVSEIATAGGVARIGAMMDIQAEVHRAEAEALRDLLQVLSHEIMNSLTPVASLADTARNYLRDEASPAANSARESLEVLSRRASGLARFVDGYRALARLPDPVKRPVDLVQLLADVAIIFRQSHGPLGVELDLALPQGPVRLDLDEALFTQALLNVLTNAVEATATNLGTRRVRLSLLVPERSVEIHIGDNGPGVPDDKRAHIFKAFVTTKVGGSGIGLSLAQQISLGHGAELVLLPCPPGEDTVFAFVFPLAS